MKKIIALVLSIVMICCFAVTVFAAESPVATEKVTITIRKAYSVDSDIKVDVEYTVDKNNTVTVKADETKYGTFKSWSFYKTVDGTKTVAAVEGVDYQVVKGSVNDKEISIEFLTSVIVCANYGDTVTDPMVNSNVDKRPSAPKTGDVTAVYAALVMIAIVAFGFGVKKVYSK